MGNVIDKAFGILEEIISSSPEPCLPTPLAEKLGLNRATCSRILKQLTDMGYLIRLSRLRGYAPGPKILTLHTIAKFEQEFLKAAIPAVDSCAERLNCSVLAARLYGGRRYVLHHRNCSSELEIQITQPCYDDIFCTATGLLLAAHLPEEEQLSCFREQRKRGAEVMAELRSESIVLQKLQDIYRRKYFECAKETQWIYAVPVYRKGKFYAALGASIPIGQHSAALSRKILTAMTQTAEEISNSLSKRYIIG